MITKSMKAIQTYRLIYLKEKKRKNSEENKRAVFIDSGNSFAVKDRSQKTISYHPRDSLRI